MGCVGTKVSNDSQLGRCIFDFERLAYAITVRDRSYELLMWLSDAVDSGKILASRAARHSGGPEAAISWMTENYLCLPEKIRPPENEVKEFASFFSTYLLTSFDVEEKPGTRGEGPILGFCRCCLCVRIVRANHLRAKKLYSSDKRRANTLMAESLTRFADKLGFQLGSDDADRIIKDDRTKRSVAYLAYGESLIERLSGKTEGPAVLAIWRVIAWDPRGGIRRGFKLEMSGFHAAINLLESTIKQIDT